MTNKIHGGFDGRSRLPVAALIGTGRLLVTGNATRKQPSDYFADNVREAVYFDFYGDHPEHGEGVEM